MAEYVKEINGHTWVLG